MKKTNSLHVLLLVFLLVSLSSCNNDNDPHPPLDTLDQILAIATLHGNLEGDTVVVLAQSGPSIELNDTEVTNEIITATGIESALFVNVHQVQTKNPELFTSSDITFEQAKQYDLQSVANLKRVVSFFKNQQKKKVYVLGISFGCLVAQELIATHGTDIADGYLILASRLNSDDESWKALSQGKFINYVYDNDGNYTIVLENDPENDTIEERNMGRLLAGFAFHRYTERLSTIPSLSKLTYVHGDRDEATGPLSSQEIQFLEAKGATVILSEGSNHDETILNTGVGLVKETFDIE